METIGEQRDLSKSLDHVLEYLARYTHRVAFANSRLVTLKDGMVIFNIKNRKKNRIERITITAVEFIRRFMLHSLPKGFVRIRHYGFLAKRNRISKLNKIRSWRGVPPLSDKENSSLEEMMRQLSGTDITTCPCCSKGKMQFFAEIPKGRARPPSHLTCLVG